MSFSVNTNVGAFVALQNLNKTTSMLETTQLRITTGLRVNGPKDDAANFAIATRLRGDIKGIESVKIALSTGDSIVNVAISAGKSIADLLTDMKAKVVQANQAGLDAASRTALNNDFTALRDQLTTIVETAEFNKLGIHFALVSPTFGFRGCDDRRLGPCRGPARAAPPAGAVGRKAGHEPANGGD